MNKENMDSVSRDNVQLLFNHLFQLPTSRKDGEVIAVLPKPTTVLPREKPVPKAKALTTWEKFAKAKGIKKEKKSRMVFDENSGEYKPRYGYKSAKNEEMNQWCVEVPDNADPFEDQFQKMHQEKKERVSKNKGLQRKNLNVDKDTASNMSRIQKKDSLLNSVKINKISTASMGKFVNTLPIEKKRRK
jgi:regulator of ribosome biosynthesis